MPRAYTDRGLLSKDSALMIYDSVLSKYVLLIPTTDLPETKGAPSTQAKTVLTDHSVTEVEGLQTNAQKVYNFNYHRDNIVQLNKYKGVTHQFLEVNPDMTGEKFTGKFSYGRSAVSVDGIVQGQLFLTVASADDEPVGDVRDLVANTAICTTPLEDLELATTTTAVVINLEGEPTSVVFTATSSATGVCTAVVGTGENAGKLTVTGVAAGNAIVTVKSSASGEADSYKSFMVTVPAVVSA